MLLKIYTDKNSLVVIENIQNIEIHNGTFIAHSVSEIFQGGQQNIVDGFQPIGPDWNKPSPMPVIEFHGSGQSPRLLDGDIRFAADDIPVKFIDYQRNDDVWRRVAIDFFGTAYLCNDQGKTIERILEPGRG